MNYEMEDIYKANDEESEIFLSEEPIKLLQQHIRSQFLHPLDLNIDYFGNFIDTYEFSKSRVVDEDDTLLLDKLRDDMYQFMLNILSKRLGVEIPEFETKDEDDQLDILHLVYRYFIINIKHNFANYCLNKMDDMANDESLRELIIGDKYNETLISNGPSVSSLKKAGVSDDDVIIIINAYDIVRSIIVNDEPDIVSFVTDSDWQVPTLETECMLDWINSDDVVGNFYPSYMNMIDDSVLKEIEAKVRSNIIKKYAGSNPVSIHEKPLEPDEVNSEVPKKK